MTATLLDHTYERQTTAPAKPVVPPEFLREYMQLPDDTCQDAVITDLIAAATDQIERQFNLALITQTWTKYLDRFPSRRGRDWGSWDKEDWDTIFLEHGPVQSITSINYLDNDNVSQVLATTEYEVSTGARPPRIVTKHEKDWPEHLGRKESVTVVYVAGFGATGDTVPEALRLAVKRQAAMWYLNRATELQLDPAIEALAANHRWGS